MKNHILQTLLTIILAFAAFPVLAQDCMIVFFKNGTSRKFYLKDVSEFCASRIDADGISHSNYDYQHVKTDKIDFVYNLADVDSVTFSKFNEEKAEDNFADAMPQVISSISDCTTIDDVEKQIEAIKGTAGVEDAWSDGHQLYVKVAEGEVFSFHFGHSVYQDIVAEENMISQIRAMMPLIKNNVGEGGTSLKVVFANQQDKDQSRNYGNQYNLLKNYLAQCGIDVEYMISPTVDFFFNNSEDPQRPNFYDYDIILLSSHGGYGDILYYKERNILPDQVLVGWKGHEIATSEDICFFPSESEEAEDYPRNWWKNSYQTFRNWRNNLVFNYATDQHINFTLNHEMRNGEWKWVMHPTLTEYFFDDIAEGRFTNPNAIFYNAACESLKGDDGSSESFANILFNKRNLGVYAGYTEKNFSGQTAGAHLLSYMSSGLSIEAAREKLPEWCKKESLENIESDPNSFTERALNNIREKGASNAELMILSNDEHKKTDFFLYPTITVEVGKDKVNEEFVSNQVVTVEGVTTYGNAGVKVGFKYGEDPNSLIYDIRTDNVVNHSGNGNRLFKAQLPGLTSGTYYYRAYTWDSVYYNYGEPCSFTINNTQLTSCPDNNHPHMIDLGLPSGTKWACCNAGSMTPEGYGDYFAWGETQPKGCYDWSTYIHCDGSEGTCHDIGSDIAGTQYDAATANWGAPWQMPTKDQCRELLDKCTSVWTTLNGINGRKFTGPNGGTIFLPATGFRANVGLYNVDSHGFYWSSSLFSDGSDSAWNLCLSSGYAHEGSYTRDWGQSVRLVTSSVLPFPSINVISLSTTDVSVTSATLNGSITVRNTDKSYVAGFFLSTTSSSPSSADYTKNVTCSSSSPVGDFSASATGLSDGTKYYYRAYVLYDGKYYYGYSKSFTTSLSASCPDDNHPHMIDLGLPSGTKWACCNVGATTPEGYGDYFAWGETSPKDYYDWGTYQYGNYNYNEDFSNLVNIGSDIAGTQYDAATANWDAPWQMPTKDQCQELLDKCTSVWTTLNGINGRKFTGPSGGTIFLPAAGLRSYGSLFDVGSNGYYWSSSLVPDYPIFTHGLYFESGGYGEAGPGRDNGAPVRPVREN